MRVTFWPEPPAFQRHQHAFVAHIRDPLSHPRPVDVPERRMQVYRELFLNNIEGLLSAGFPVIRLITADERWQAMVRDFFARHRCRTPLFLEIGKEFVEYLQVERGARAEDPPFLAELAHYEWVELALSVSDADPAGGEQVDGDGDLLSGHPLLSHLAWPLRYRFPVHRIAPDDMPSAPGETPSCLLVYRDSSDRVRFLEITEVTYLLLDLLRAEPLISGRDALLRVSRTLAHPQPDAVVGFGLALLTELKERGLILGTR